MGWMEVEDARDLQSFKRTVAILIVVLPIVFILFMMAFGFSEKHEKDIDTYNYKIEQEIYE